MDIIVNREALLKALQPIVSSISEKKNQQSILSHVYLACDTTSLRLMGSDAEIDLALLAPIESCPSPGEITVSFRKLLETVRSLPDHASVQLVTEDKSPDKMLVKSGRTRFVLSTLPAEDFPLGEAIDPTLQMTLPERELLFLLERTHFAMADQDLRHYFNGILLVWDERQLSAVATDGHRLAKASIEIPQSCGKQQVLLPRRAVLEMLRFLQAGNSDVQVNISPQHFRVQTPLLSFSSRLIDGRFPDYAKVIPTEHERLLRVDTEMLKDTLARAMVLCSDKFREVSFSLKPNHLRISVSNPQNEYLEEELDVDYTQDPLDIHFDVRYLLDVLNAVVPGILLFSIKDENSAVLLTEGAQTGALYVVMPMQR